MTLGVFCVRYQQVALVALHGLLSAHHLSQSIVQLIQGFTAWSFQLWRKKPGSTQLGLTLWSSISTSFCPEQKKSSTNNLRVNLSLPVWWAGRETASCIWLKVETSGTGDEGTSVKTCDCSLHWRSCFMIAARWRNTHLFQHLRNELWWPAALKVFFYKL